MNRKKSFWPILASVLCACAVGTFFASRERSEDLNKPLNDSTTEKATKKVAGNTATGVAVLPSVQSGNVGKNDPTLVRREMRKPDFSRQIAWLESGELPQKGDVFSVDFFDDKSFVFHVDSADKTLVNGKPMVMVSGRTQESGLLVATCIVSDGKVFASVNDFENARDYSIAYDFKRGAYFSNENDTTKLPACATCGKTHAKHGKHAHADKPVLSAEETASVKTQLAGVADDAGKTYTVDYLVVYDTTGEEYAKETGGTDVVAAAAVVRMNACFDNSGIDAAYRLAGVEVLDYTSDGDFYTALDDISGYGDADVGNEVAELRDFYGADIVQLYHSGSGVAGLGWVGPAKGQMFSVVGVQYAKASETPAHEAGHNMGCRHSREQESSPGDHPYAVGANNTTTPGNTQYFGSPAYYHSVMSYGVSFLKDPNDPDSTEYTRRAPIFSGPNSVYDGVLLGSETEDNVRKINESLPSVVDYYMPGPFSVSSVEFGNEGGEQSVALESEYEWTAKTNVSWLTLAPEAGGSSETLTLTAESNPYCIPRSGKIIVTARDVPFELPVTQEAAVAVMKILDASGTEITEWTNVPNTGIEYEFSLETNWPSLIASVPAWASASINMTTKKLKVVVSANEALVGREGEIKLYYPGDKTNPVVTLKISQLRGDPFLVVYDGKAIELGKNEGRKSIYVHSNVEWKCELGDNASWLNASNSGSTETIIGDGYMLVTYDENLRTTVRRATLNFTFADHDGNLLNTQQVVVTQKASPPFVTLSKESLLFNYKAGAQAIELRANTTWKLISTLPEWISLSEISGNEGTHALTLSVKQNSDPEAGRSATLEFEADGKTAKLSVSQGLMQTITSSTAKVVFPSNGGVRELKLYANGTWKAVYWPEWISINPQGGNAPDDGILVLNLTSEANTEAASRSGWLTLECGESRLSIALEQQRPYVESEAEDSGVPEFGAFDYADASEYLYLDAAGEERSVSLGFEVGEAEVVFTLDPEWLDCELDAKNPSLLWVQAIPNVDAELRETWIFVLMKNGDLHAIPVKQANE